MSVLLFPSPKTDFERSLKIVVIENPFQSWNQTSVPDLFKDIIGLKRFGYDGYYPHGFLPIDTGDFVASHILVCQENATGLIPIMGYRSITISRCQEYRLGFPPEAGLAKDPDTTFHIQSVKQTIQRLANANQNLTYAGSWTVIPAVRDDKEKVSILKDVTVALFFHYQTDFRIQEEYGFGVPKIKTDSFFAKIGYERVSFEGKVLPAIRHADIGAEEIFLMKRVHFSDFAKVTATRYLKLWENMIYIEPIITPLKKSA